MKHLLRLLLLPLCLFACKKAAEPACCAGEEELAAASDRSLFQLTSTWTAQSTRTLHLRDLPGEVRVLAMIYTTCEYACPVILADLKKVEAMLSPAQRQKVHFVLVTMDPARDTVEVLAQYARERELDPKRWTLLRGSADDTLELANVLGFKFKQVGKGFSHSNVFFVLDQKGEVVHQQPGLQTGPAEPVTAIGRMLE